MAMTGRGKNINRWTIDIIDITDISVDDAVRRIEERGVHREPEEVGETMWVNEHNLVSVKDWNGKIVWECQGCGEIRIDSFYFNRKKLKHE